MKGGVACIVGSPHIPWRSFPAVCCCMLPDKLSALCPINNDTPHLSPHHHHQQNLLQHESEIFSRPARTWFQTEKEKKAAAAAAAAAAAQGKTVLEMDAAGQSVGWSKRQHRHFWAFYLSCCSCSNTASTLQGDDFC